MRTKQMIGLALMAACMTSLGCARTLTYERWSTLHNGQTPESVEATLGEPWRSIDETWFYHDEDRGITASIFFEDNSMIGKQWADPDRGIVGSNPRVNKVGDAETTRIQTIDN